MLKIHPSPSPSNTKSNNQIPIIVNSLHRKSQEGIDELIHKIKKNKETNSILNTKINNNNNKTKASKSYSDRNPNSSIQTEEIHKRLDNTSSLKSSFRNANSLSALAMRKAIDQATNISLSNTKKQLEKQLRQTKHDHAVHHFKIRRLSTTIRDETTDSKIIEQIYPFLLMRPDSTFFRFWQMLTFLLVSYQSAYLPFALAFLPRTNEINFIDSSIDIIFGLDILFQFNVARPHPTKPEWTITDRKLIAKLYLKGWFIMDLMACFPFDRVVVLFNNDATNSLQILGLLKGLRLPRLLRLFRILRVLKLLRLSPEIKRWFQYSRHANLLRLVRLLISFLVLTHILTCIWWALIVQEQYRLHYYYRDGLIHQYFMSFYLCLLVLMGEMINPYDNSEIIFSCIGLMLGSFLMATVFGNVAVLIANFTANPIANQKKMEYLFEAMKRMQLPANLQTRIHQYYQIMWERHGTLDGSMLSFIPELSKNLSAEVLLFLRMDMIQNAPFFNQCSPEVVQELVLKLTVQAYMPKDYVIVRGEVGDNMYFVQSGICEVTRDIVLNDQITSNNTNNMNNPIEIDHKIKDLDSNRYLNTIHPLSSSSKIEIDPTNKKNMKEYILKRLKQGDYFGEIALLMNCKRTANVRTETFVELCLLSREVFEEVANRYTDDRTIIQDLILEKYDMSALQYVKHEIETNVENINDITLNNIKKINSNYNQMNRHSFSNNNNNNNNNVNTVINHLEKILFRLDKLEGKIGLVKRLSNTNAIDNIHYLNDSQRQISHSRLNDININSSLTNNNNNNNNNNLININNKENILRQNDSFIGKIKKNQQKEIEYDNNNNNNNNNQLLDNNINNLNSSFINKKLDPMYTTDTNKLESNINERKKSLESLNKHKLLPIYSTTNDIKKDEFDSIIQNDLNKINNNNIIENNNNIIKNNINIYEDNNKNSMIDNNINELDKKGLNDIDKDKE